MLCECLSSSSAHEHIIQAAASSQLTVIMPTESDLDDYSAVSGLFSTFTMRMYLSYLFTPILIVIFLQLFVSPFINFASVT